MLPPQSFLDELRARIGLASVIGRRVRLQRKGREHQGLCPFHNEKTPSFTVNEAKGFYHCFGCGAHGNVFSFVMKIEGLNFHEAIERLAAEAGLEMPKPTPEAAAAAARQASMIEVVEAACTLFEAELGSAEGAAARTYLEERGVSPQSRDRFRLGYAPDRRSFLAARLTAQGIKLEQLIEAGLAKNDERSGRLVEYFFGRIIFPITDRRGRVVAFGGRRIGKEGPKYLNSPDNTLFHKGELLYNLTAAQKAIRGGGQALLLVEGYMDVIALVQAGIETVVAPLGTAVTEGQLALAWRLADEPLVCLDGDAAGRHAARRLAKRALPLLKPGKSLNLVFLPEGEDPDSLLRTASTQALRERLHAHMPLASFVWEHATASGLPQTPERWAALRSELMATAGRIEDPSVQKGYRSFLLDRYYNALRQGHRAHGWRPPVPDKRGRHLVKPMPEGQCHRQEREFLAILLNHPEAASPHLEELAALTFSIRTLESLKCSTIDSLAVETELGQQL